MRGILELDGVCLKKIFAFLKPLDLRSLRQSCKQLRYFVDDHFRLVYFVRQEWLDLRAENTRNVYKILCNFRKLVRRIRISFMGKDARGRNLLFDVIFTKCGAILKGLWLNDLNHNEIDREKLASIRFDKLEVLKLFRCDDIEFIEKLLLEQEYPNLTTLSAESTFIDMETLKMFFMRKRNIKYLINVYIHHEHLPLIVKSAPELEELDIYPNDDARNYILLAQSRKLRRLRIECRNQVTIVPLIKELSVNEQLESLLIAHFEFSDEFCDALSNLTNLKKLRLWNGRYTINNTQSIEKLGRKLSKLELLILAECTDFPYQYFLPAACKSDKFRKIYVYVDYCKYNNFEQVVQGFIDGRRHYRCFVSGDPLCIYVNPATFYRMQGLLTQDNLQSIEKYRNIKILRADRAKMNFYLFDL